MDMIEQGPNSFTKSDGVTRENSVMIVEIYLNDMCGIDLNVSSKDLVIVCSY